MSFPQFPQNKTPKHEDAEIAAALVAIMDTQDMILELVGSIWTGMPRKGFLDDTRFRATNTRREFAKNALKNKYKVF